MPKQAAAIPSWLIIIIESHTLLSSDDDYFCNAVCESRLYFSNSGKPRISNLLLIY